MATPTLSLAPTRANNKAKAVAPLDARRLSAPVQQSQDRKTVLPHLPSGIPVQAPSNEPPPAGWRPMVGPLLPLQRKVVIGSTSDPLEAEADRVADQVVGMGAPAPQIAASGAGPAVQRKCACEGSGSECPECRKKKEEKLQRKAQSPVTPVEAPPIVHHVLCSPGQALDGATRAFFEPRLGQDLSHVRVHADAQANRSAAAVASHAYAVDSDIVFAEGKYQPANPDGRRLLAHELAHVMQQGSGGAVIRRQADGGAPDAGAAQGTVVDRVIAALNEPQENGVGNYGEAYSILNGLWIVDMMHQIETLKARGSFDLLRDNSPGTMFRVDVAMAAVQAKGTAAAATFAADHPAMANLPEQQQKEVNDYLGASQPQQQAQAQTPAPGQQQEQTAQPSQQVDRTPTMTATERLIEAYHRAKLAPAFKAKLESLVSLESLAAMLIGFAAAFAIAQLTPVGWAADVGLLLTGVFVGASVLAVAKHLVAFAAAANAQTSTELDQAGAEFAAAVAEGSVDLILALLTHKLGGGEGPPAEEPVPQAAQVRVAVRGDRLVLVAADTVPADVAAAMGVKGAIITGPLLAMSGGPGSPKLPPTSGSPGVYGARSGAGTEAARAAEEGYIAKLKKLFPKLAPLDIRPKLRPGGSSYVGPAEDVTPEVGGKQEYRTQVSGAPESAFEERMRTSQGQFSLTIIDKGVAMELDGISEDGWLDNVKIEQKLNNVDNIVARLRVEADWAENYGLKGVHYSIAPPNVADAVEQALAEQGVRNVYRVE